MFPWIPFLKQKAGGKLSDIEFLAVKEFGSKRVDVDTETSVDNTVTETTIVTATAASGKDMYLGTASIAASVTTTAANLAIKWKLYINGTVEEIINSNFPVSQVLGSAIFEFKSKGLKVAATEIIKITATHSISTSTSQSINAGKLVLFEEATGETPQVASI